MKTHTTGREENDIEGATKTQSFPYVNLFCFRCNDKMWRGQGGNNQNPTPVLFHIKHFYTLSETRSMN